MPIFNLYCDHETNISGLAFKYLSLYNLSVIPLNMLKTIKGDKVIRIRSPYLRKKLNSKSISALESNTSGRFFLLKMKRRNLKRWNKKWLTSTPTYWRTYFLKLWKMGNGRVKKFYACKKYGKGKEYINCAAYGKTEIKSFLEKVSDWFIIFGYFKKRERGKDFTKTCRSSYNKIERGKKTRGINMDFFVQAVIITDFWL